MIMTTTTDNNHHHHHYHHRTALLHQCLPAKSTEPIEICPELAELYVDGFDNDQIWEEVQLRNGSTLAYLEQGLEMLSAQVDDQDDQSDDAEESEDIEQDDEDIEQDDEDDDIDFMQALDDEEDGDQEEQQDGDSDTDHQDFFSAKDDFSSMPMSELADGLDEQEDEDEDGMEVPSDADADAEVPEPAVAPRRRGPRSRLDDDFFSLAEMEEFADQDDRDDVPVNSDEEIDYSRGTSQCGSRRSRVPSHFILCLSVSLSVPLSRSIVDPNELGNTDDELDEEHDGDGDDDDDDEPVDLHYRDFFDPPAKEKPFPKSKQSSFSSTKKRTAREQWDVDYEKADGSDVSEVENDNANANDDKSAQQAKDLFGEGDQDSVPAEEALTGHQKKMKRLEESIRTMEEENVAKKEWALMGEVPTERSM